MKLSDLKNAGHWPTLLTAFLYFNFSFMVWTVLGPLGAQIGETLKLSPEQKGLLTGPVGAGGGIGGFYLASSLGLSKGITGSYQYGFLVFASLCFLAIVGLSLVKTRWRSTWGALAGARI
jgi:NNP family nitrate/nitrite transporter-like MFS transporter